MELNIKHQSYWRNKRTVSSEYSNYIRGHAPPEECLKMDSWKRHILHSLDRTQLIDIVIHDSRAEVQRFMIPKFLKQRFMILTFFATMIHDSASTPESGG